METDIRLHSITKRWIFNIMTVDVIVVLICEIFLGLFVFGYYRDRVIDASGEYVRDINVLSMTDENGFHDAARRYAQTFKYRDKVEVQIFDNDDSMLVTTNGFASPGVAQKATDYSEAKKNGKEAWWYGRNDNGERVLAITTVLPDLGHGSNGAYRVLVSMETIVRNYCVFLLMAILVGLLVIGFSVMSGVFFVRSIVRPVREVTATARKIAGGDLKTRLEVKQNDEIGELCDTINYMAAELENNNKLKNDFISSVSHELRTPLTAIKGWGETVRLSVDEGDEIVRHGVDVMLGEAERLSGLVEELLDFSRIEAGKLTVTPVLNDPIVIVSSVVDMYEEIARQQKISLVFVKPEKTEMIMADRDRLKQVFINIIDNAVKYTEAGGHIVVSAFNEEGCIRLTISDTGCGIPAKDLNHVKEKFFKANSNVRGSGIGLAVADEIIKSHNGLMFLESVEGEGTTVTVVLPTVKEQPGEVTEVIFPPDKKG
ncbi:MAG: HAMP domain-containing histidine kinase [Clostridia bacterium]|nr:HAMP domain-containing histidine kinase [Clostridia bacterium]